MTHAYRRNWTAEEDALLLPYLTNVMSGAVQIALAALFDCTPKAIQCRMSTLRAKARGKTRSVISEGRAKPVLEAVDRVCLACREPFTAYSRWVFRCGCNAGMETLDTVDHQAHVRLR